jgi:hypothetical protein
MESLRISFHNNQFHRTNPQDHNKQLIILLHQLQEILDRMTGQIVKTTKDSPGTALAISSSSSLQSKGSDHVAKMMEAMLRVELTPFYETCQQHISDLTAQVSFSFPPSLPYDLLQLLSPLNNSLEEYFRFSFTRSPLTSSLILDFRDILLGLLKEGGGMVSASTSLASNKTAPPASGCSRSACILLDRSHPHSSMCPPPQSC